MGLTEGLCNAGTVAASIATQSAMTAANPVGAVANAASRFNSPPTVVVIGNQPTAPAPGQSGANNANGTVTSGTQTTANTPPVVDEEAAKKAKANKEDLLSRLRTKFTVTKAFKRPTAATPTDANKAVANGTQSMSGQIAAETKATTNNDGNVVVTPEESKSADDHTVANRTAKPAAPEFNRKFYATDPALILISVIEPWVTTIQNIIVDAQGARSMDWASVLPPNTKDEKGREMSSDAQTVFYNLERKKKEFKPDVKGLASQLTTRVINETYEVVKEMLEESKKSKGIEDWVQPANDSELVQSWGDRIDVCADVAATLKQSAASQPGMAPAIMQSLFPKKTEAETVASTNLRASVAEQTIKAATTKLTSAQDVYKSTLATYESMNAQKFKMQEELTKAQAEVAKLTAQGITAADVRKVLVKCIGFLAQLKSKIASLVEFFSKVSTFVEGIVSTQIKSFQDTIAGMIQQWPNDMLKQFRYNAFLRDNLFQVTMQIMAQFSLCRNMAVMYSEVHDRCIKPGLYLVDKCGIPADKMVEKMTPDEKLKWEKQIEEKRNDLTKFATDSRTTVQTIVQKKQDEMMASLKKRISDIDQELGEFPVELKPLPNTPAGQAMEDGKQIASHAAAEESLSQPSAMGMVTGNDDIDVSGNW